MTQVIDPLKFKELMWPDVTFASYQNDIIYSVMENDETFVPAGNMLGKDFVAAFIILWFFLTRQPCRIVTTSAKEDHLRVLWDEMKQFIQDAKHPLDVRHGGPLIINKREIRRIGTNGEETPKCYIKGMVASGESIAAMQGHHLPRVDIPLTMFLPDECSSVPDTYYTMARTWFHRMLAIGNTWPCENFFKHAIKGKPGTKDKGGDILDPNIPGRFYRKIHHFRADDSPNVRMGKALIKRHGKSVMKRRDFLKMTMIVPGILPFGEYLKRRELLEPQVQCVSLDAEWYEGPEEKLFPKEWLDLAEEIAANWPRGDCPRSAFNVMGVDVAEGGDDTAWCVMNHFGILHIESYKTQDTTVIIPTTLRLMRKYDVQDTDVAFDQGGGGYIHACNIRKYHGKNVTTVNFGGSVLPEKKRGMTSLERKKLEAETTYAYINRRGQMYGMFSEALNPMFARDENLELIRNKEGDMRPTHVPFGIPAKYSELRRQLAPLPKQYDREGRLWLPPKDRKPGSTATSTTIILKDILGCSPDQADAAVLARHRLEYRGKYYTQAGGVS